MTLDDVRVYTCDGCGNEEPGFLECGPLLPDGEWRMPAGWFRCEDIEALGYFCRLDCTQAFFGKTESLHAAEQELAAVLAAVQRYLAAFDAASDEDREDNGGLTIAERFALIDLRALADHRAAASESAPRAPLT